MLDSSYFNIKGAVYIPARAYNSYQLYEYFDEKEIDRDFGYAESIGINSLRIFTSFEQWQKNKELFWLKIESLLSIACRHKIRPMLVLFENCGEPFSVDYALSRDPLKSVCVQSPGRIITSDRSLWKESYEYVSAFMDRYKDDKRIIAIEVMNEPNLGTGDLEFAVEMTKLARSSNPSVPLTIGNISIHHVVYFDGLLDIFQHHSNFPTSIAEFENELRELELVQRLTGKPVWLSEWQRLRTSGPGWHKDIIPEEEKSPALYTLAEKVYSSSIAGSYFWCLMVKPAYLMAQRPNGTFNGLFFEDGSVYSRDDYFSVGGKDKDIMEYRNIPKWFEDDLKNSSLSI